MSREPITTPSPADAGLRDALARANFNWDCRWLSAADLERTWIDPSWAGRRQQAFRHADALLTGPLATETRARAEVERERDEAEDACARMVRLSEMGFAESLKEPEEDGNYASYCRAKVIADRKASRGSGQCCTSSVDTLTARLATAEAEIAVLRAERAKHMRWLGLSDDMSDDERGRAEEALEWVAVAHDDWRNDIRAALAASPKEGPADVQ